MSEEEKLQLGAEMTALQGEQQEMLLQVGAVD